MSTTTETSKPAATPAAAAPRPRRPRPQVMSVTPAAAARVKALIEGPGKPTAGIRIGVRRRASSEAAALNDAYRTLKDPLGRAVYLAELRGVELPGDGKTIDDPDLLMEAMETREALHEAATPDAVDALAVQAKRQAQLALAELADLYLHEDKPAIRKTLLRLRYSAQLARQPRARAMNLDRTED